jgi:2-dehydropantoate 2-reductase
MYSVVGGNGMSKRIAVMGAGAIGASIGAYLIREGHDVTLIDQWGAHVEKMKSDGIKLTDLKESFTVPAKALHLSEVSNVREPFDIIYLAVKSYDTRWSTYLIEPILKSTGFVLPAQNALNDELVASIVGYPRTAGCVPAFSAGVYEPGHVVRTDPMTTHCFTVGELSGMITPRVKEVVDALQVMGPSDATGNIWGARWAKLMVNCMGNALSGLLGPDTSAMTDEQKETAALVRVTTGCEVARVAQAMGIVVEPLATTDISGQEFAAAATGEAIRTLKDRLEASSGQRSLTPEQIKHLGAPGRPSLLQDVIKGRRTEADELNGHVVAKGKEVGVAAPMNQAIVEAMKALERGEIKPVPSNVDRLKPSIPA